MTGRFAEQVPEDRRRPGRTARRMRAAGRCRGGEEREMVRSLERDERGAIRGCRRGRARLGSERRRQPLAKAALGVRTAAEAIGEIAAQVDRVPRRVACGVGGCGGDIGLDVGAHAGMVEAGAGGLAGAWLRLWDEPSVRIPAQEPAGQRRNVQPHRHSQALLAGERQRLIQCLEVIRAASWLAGRPLQRNAHAVEPELPNRLEIRGRARGVAGALAPVGHSHWDERLLPALHRLLAPAGGEHQADRPQQDSELHLSCGPCSNLVGHCRRGFSLTTVARTVIVLICLLNSPTDSDRSMTETTAATRQVTLDEIRAARRAHQATRARDAAHRRLRTGRTAALPQVREPAAGRRVQDSRRLQHGRAAHARRARGAASSPTRPAITARRWRSRHASSARRRSSSCRRRRRRSRSRARGRSAPK